MAFWSISLSNGKGKSHIRSVRWEVPAREDTGHFAEWPTIIKKSECGINVCR